MGIQPRHIIGAGFIGTAYKQWLLLRNPRRVKYTEQTGNITREGEYYDMLPGGHFVRSAYLMSLLGLAAKCYEPELEYLLQKADQYGSEFGQYVRERLQRPRDRRGVDDV